jgi:hypothetical protein
MLTYNEMRKILAAFTAFQGHCMHDTYYVPLDSVLKYLVEYVEETEGKMQFYKDGLKFKLTTQKPTEK